MADDRLRTLRRLAKSYRITFRLPSDEWPAAHSTTFQNIQKLGDQKFDSYCESVNIRSQEEPWVEQTKHRAQWLANRASQLFGQQRNEAGWRFGLENDVLRRFSVEVACPKCRARVWRSEIEASLDESSGLAQNLEQRKRDRTRCQCPPESRPEDYYEIGTNLLFDDRAQELIIHDSILRCELPKQSPDRIYGLRATRNFVQLLSRSMPNISSRSDSTTVSDVISSSPFGADLDPLLFPFLVLEAKSESSAYGFDNIQTQTAFPIWALLKLQEGLQSHKVGPESSFAPLVWFIANRGDTWRVYSCCTTHRTDNEPTSYDIYLLWNGSIMFKDSALQLVLIVDYILDWARDIYRPSILRHLKSISTGKSYDEISLADDSDIFSMRRDISSWIPAPPSTIGALDLGGNEEYSDIDRLDLLQIPIPNTKLGTVRSAGLTEFRFVSLYITQSNVTSLLQLAGGRNQNTDSSAKVARQLVNFITGWDEILLLTAADLDELENIWTGNVRSDNNVSSTEEFYVALESRCFMSYSWQITKEMTCVALSKPAFVVLMTYANFKRKHPLVDALPDILRPCPMTVLRECAECLKSGSPWQVLISAISCLLMSLYPMPERKRVDFTPPVEFLAFGYNRFSRVKPFIQKFLEFGQENSAKRRRAESGGKADDLFRRLLGRGKSNAERIILDLSFRRVSDRRAHNAEGDHDLEQCGRCRQDTQDDLYKRNLAMVKPPIVSTYGAILVESPNSWDSQAAKRHDLCLFVVEKSTLLEEIDVLPLVLEDILQTDMLYHTISHSPIKDAQSVRALIWNVPLPYRPPTDEQRLDVMNWCQELLGNAVAKKHQLKDNTDNTDIWSHHQMLLRFLDAGFSYADASNAVTKFCHQIHPDRVREMNETGRKNGFERIEDPDRRVDLKDFFEWIRRQDFKKRGRTELTPLYPPPKISLKGSIGNVLKNCIGEEMNWSRT